MSEHYGVVGGGLLGLSLADRLSKLGHRVTVLEAAPHLGGLASAWTLAVSYPPATAGGAVSSPPLSKGGPGGVGHAEEPPPPAPPWKGGEEIKDPQHRSTLPPWIEGGPGGVAGKAHSSTPFLPPPLSKGGPGGVGSDTAPSPDPSWKGGEEHLTWDRFYHVILLSDTHTHELLRQLNLEGEFVGVETKTGFYTDGRLHSLSNSVEFLTFPPLGLLSKFRLGLTILHASRVTDWKALERVPVVDWLTKWSGRRTVEKMWLPLLRAKLGDSYKDASAAFIWATIARMYAARRSGMKKELFGYVRGGYARVVGRFAEDLAARGVELRTSAPVARIDSPPGVGPRVELASGETLRFDKVVCTAVPPLASKLVPDLTPGEHAALDAMKYQGIICASVVLKKPLDRFYVTNITDSWVPFTAVIEMSALVDREQFGGHCLVYLPKYVAPDDPVMTEADDSIRERFLAALERMYPHFTRDDVLAFRIARVKHVFAVPTLNYSDHLPPMTTSVPGVHLVNSAHIVNGTLNVNETLALAERALPALLPSPLAGEGLGVRGSAAA